MLRDEQSALSGRDRLRRCERPDARVAEGSRLAAVPRGTVGVGAVLEQDDPLGPAELDDPVDVERDVAADVDDHRRRRLVQRDLPLEVVERHAEVGAIAVDELDPRAGRQHRERRGHERVRRAEDGLAAQLEELERREGRARPAGGGDRRQSVPRRPACSRRPSRAARPTRPRHRGCRPRAHAAAPGRGGRSRLRTCRGPCRSEGPPSSRARSGGGSLRRMPNHI